MSDLLFHVSPDGDLSLEQARDDARRAGPEARREIQLRGGTYFLPRTFALGPEDSNLVFTAAPGERPVLSGGFRVTGWTAGTRDGKTCWTATVPAGSDFKQLFVNGQRRLRPRFPKRGYHRFASIPEGGAGAGRFGHGPDRACFTPGDISPDWHDLGAVELVALELWFSTHHRIKRIDPERSELEFFGPSLGKLRDENGSGLARYYLENVQEALSEPGEWYLDRQSGHITYSPLPHESLESAEIVAPRLETLVRVAGAADVRFENLSFQHAEWRTAETFVGSIQAAFDVPGAVVFERAERCVLRDCQVAHVSQYGVEIGRGCHDCEIVGCEIADLGAGGVRIDHEWCDRVNETSRSVVLAESGGKPNGTRVANCSIHDGGRIHLGAIGVWIGNAGHVRILDNHIYNFNYTGVSCGWTWGYAPTATVDNRIEGNHIHHICWDRPLSDNGGIYILGPHPGGRIARNHIHHVGCHHYGAWGIYLDEGTSFMTVAENVTHHVGCGFHIHYGRGNLVCDNIFALSSKQAFVLSRPEAVRSCVFERNLIYSTEGQPGGGVKDSRHFLIRDCLFWMEGLSKDFADGASLEQWQERGQLLGCVVADPLFHDPEGGDFTLRPDSPAFKLGFNRKRAVPETILAASLEWAADNELRLTLRNHGAAPASGHLVVAAGPEGVAKLKGPGDFRFDNLAPGEERAGVFPVAADPEADFCFAACDGPSPVFVSRLKGPRLQAGSDLESTAWRPLLRSAGMEAARWKLAVGPDALRFQAQVLDLRHVAASSPWEGSSIEFFVAPRKTADRTELTQLFFSPVSDWSAAVVARADNSVPVPEPRVTATCAPLSGGGYELRAVIPFAAVKLEAPVPEFLFEAIINATFAAGSGLGHQTLFGAACACANTTGYARVAVK